MRGGRELKGAESLVTAVSILAVRIRGEHYGFIKEHDARTFESRRVYARARATTRSS